MRLKKLLPLTLCGAALLLAAARPAAAQGAAWRPYQPPSKLFTAEFPGVPSYETRSIDQGISKGTAHRHWLALPGKEGGHFEVTHVKAPPNDGDLPIGIILDAIIDTLLNQHRQRGLRESARREVTARGCVGREFEAVDDAGLTLRGRIFVVGDQIINAIYVGPARSDARRQEASRFLGSLTPVETCAPQPTEMPRGEIKKLGGLSGPVDAASGWMLITPARSGFSALMPGAAEVEEEQAQEKPYPLTLHTYSAENSEGAYVVVVVGDFPEELNRIPNFEEIKFNLAYRGLQSEAEKYGGRVVQEGDVNVGGRQGRQYRLTSEQLSGRALIISTPKKVYLFGAFAGGPKPPDADFARFFSSLKIGEP
jgi:hypothetical protein